jgi:hypothetical protein
MSWSICKDMLGSLDLLARKVMGFTTQFFHKNWRRNYK